MYRVRHNQTHGADESPLPETGSSRGVRITARWIDPLLGEEGFSYPVGWATQGHSSVLAREHMPSVCRLSFRRFWAWEPGTNHASGHCPAPGVFAGMFFFTMNILASSRTSNPSREATGAVQHLPFAGPFGVKSSSRCTSSHFSGLAFIRASNP